MKIPTWKAFDELQTLVNQINTNVSALQTVVNALQNNDYVTSVNQIFEGGVVVGYTINFSKSGPVTIYHGKDGAEGKPGAAGKDGRTPVIGVKQDSDGVYYWTVDGVWLLDAAGNKVPATGKDGADGSDGKPGADGSDGRPGAAGNDGVTPQLKIENDYWYVSYDNGSTWEQLGKATGEDGNNGANGDSMFKNVDASNPDYVLFVLSDGTQMKIPTWKAYEDLMTLVNQMNYNISALQTAVMALENNDYVTAVSPIIENGEVIGYTITFAKSGSVIIYHGKDGADGKPGADGTDGNDGRTPQIGIGKDADGKYYWTLDGNWLLDADGKKIPATGADGKPGTNGSAGAAGKDGITPQLKIENGYWHVSYDNGNTWEQLGKATGEAGNDGASGDSMFKNVDASNSDYVLFVLSDGTQIKIPTWKAFEALQTLVSQMNSNISALQKAVQALENNDYVTAITPMTENGKVVGYSITFAKSGPIVIYHGKDGADGKPGADGTDGNDGHTPKIGVAQDTDGKYYWTLDGQWLLDAAGNKIPTTGKDGEDGTDGKPGADGSAGAAGNDGVTPKLKIENGYWYVSYDNEITWEQLGQATGDQGPAGSNSECLFDSVTWDNDYVYLKLADGQTIKIPQASVANAGNGVTIELSSTSEFSALFYGTFENKGVDMKVTVYYGPSSSLSLYNYQGSVSRTSFSGSSYTLTVDKLFSDTKYYYFTETVNNGKTVYSDVNWFRTKAVTGYEDDFSTSGAVNLSSGGTANCYIVTSPGTYCISAVKGNSSTSVGSVSLATVIWETFGTSVTPTRGDLVKGALYKDGKVYFKTNSTFMEGNALIAVKDASGNILWSWHIWMTDQPAGQVYYNNAGTVMDRNLGATSATPGDVKALGLMYQWGRKDPFMGSSNINSPVQAASTISWPDPKKSTSTTGTVDYATKNPTVMLKGENNNRWLYVKDGTLWASSKTIYDPCPAGWQIPQGGDSGYWVRAYGSSIIYGDKFDYTNRGVNFSGYFGSDKTIWYPATGYYGKADGSFYGTGKDASYPTYTLESYGMLIYGIRSDEDRVYMVYLSDMGGADPVRCVRE